MTRVFPTTALLLGVVVELELDEHAASPAANRRAAATTKSRLGLCNLLISLVFLSVSLVAS
jgi:hypothetical protein